MTTAVIKALEEQCGSFFATPAPNERGKLRRAAEPCLTSLATVRVDMPDIASFVQLLPSLVALCGSPTYDKALLRVHRTVLALLSGFPLGDLPEAVTTAADATTSSLFSLLRDPSKWVSTSAGRGDALSQFGESPHVVMGSAAVLHDYLDWLVPLQSSLVVETNWHTWMAADGEDDASLLGHMTRWLEQAAARQMYQGKRKKFKEEELITNADLRIHLIRLARSLVQHPCSRALAAGAWYSLVVCVGGRIGEPHFFLRDGMVCVEALRFLALLGESGPLSRFTWVGILNNVVVRVFPSTADEALRMMTATMEERKQSWVAFGSHHDRLSSVPRVVSTGGFNLDDAEAGEHEGVSDETAPGGEGEGVAEEDAEPMRVKDGLPLYISEGLRAAFDLLMTGLTVPEEALDAAAVGNLVGPLNALLLVSSHLPSTLDERSGTVPRVASAPLEELFYCVAKVFAPKSKVPDIVLARLYRSLCASTRFLANTVGLLTEKMRVACWRVCERGNLQLSLRCVTSLCEVLTWVLVAVLEEHRNSNSSGTTACAPAHKVNALVSTALAEVEEVMASFFYRLAKDASFVDFYAQFIEAHLLNLLLAFVTDAVLTVGVAEEGAWLYSTRQQLYHVAAAVDRCVDKCVQRSPAAVVTAVEVKLDGVSKAISPFVRRIRSLLPSPDGKRLSSSGATRLFDVMCDTIVLF